MTTDYPFADRAAEDERLIAQGRVFFDAHSRRLFEKAGLAPGMRVLDLGSGSGNVSRLAADMVGPDGSVVGIERDPEAVELARRRTDAANIEYRVGDVSTLKGVEDGFDAVVGRLIIMYTPDPVATIRQAAARVRPGGLVCLHEADLDYQWSSPEPPLLAQAHRWFSEALVKAGIELRMGPRLYAAYGEAGLPEPRMLVEAFAQGGPDAPTWGWANLVNGMIGLLERTGVATRAEMDPPTLADRMLAELRSANGYIIGPLMTGAWTTKPPA